MLGIEKKFRRKNLDCMRRRKSDLHGGRDRLDVAYQAQACRLWRFTHRNAIRLCDRVALRIITSSDENTIPEGYRTLSGAKHVSSSGSRVDEFNHSLIRR
jgi:hypothetical protein